jgi:hypothetical protein
MADGGATWTEIFPSCGSPLGLPTLPSLVIDPQNSGTRFQVAKGGRFLLPLLVEPEASTPMSVVLNWPQMLKTK